MPGWTPHEVTSKTSCKLKISLQIDVHDWYKIIPTIPPPNIAKIIVNRVPIRSVKSWRRWGCWSGISLASSMASANSGSLSASKMNEGWAQFDESPLKMVGLVLSRFSRASRVCGHISWFYPSRNRRIKRHTIWKLCPLGNKDNLLVQLLLKAGDTGALEANGLTSGI